MESAPRQFDTDHIYYQWLKFRGAGVQKFERITWTIVWIVTWALIAQGLALYAIYQIDEGILDRILANQTAEVIMYIMMITGSLMVLAVPPLVILRDFLFYIPRAVRADVESNVLKGVFISPVTSKEILTDLFRWAVGLNMKHLAPSMTLGGAALVMTGIQFLIEGDPFDVIEAAHTVLPIVVLVLTLWTFILVSGLGMAASPDWVNIPGVVILVWFLPALFFVFGYGSLIAAGSYSTLTDILYLDTIYTGRRFWAHEAFWQMSVFTFMLATLIFLVLGNLVKMMDARRRVRQ